MYFTECTPSLVLFPSPSLLTPVGPSPCDVWYPYKCPLPYVATSSGGRHDFVLAPCLLPSFLCANFLHSAFRGPHPPSVFGGITLKYRSIPRIYYLRITPTRYICNHEQPRQPRHHVNNYRYQIPFSVLHGPQLPSVWGGGVNVEMSVYTIFPLSLIHI